ncbi:hypothetical protein E4U42_007866 [Claviceps africana]|uniref:Uncharacterized protein n=1 Tax=Claviceps africana TaxID=83212 RepID=A0A8K0J192_9HYPO|nr:hypothetical protein E4U42_007866 [Claviceps africana]
MPKFASIVIAALAAVAPLAEAGNCTPGLKYCGHTLLAYGNYESRIYQALGHGPSSWNNEEQRSLFNCVGPNGEIQLERTCAKLCIDQGLGQSDKCWY